MNIRFYLSYDIEITLKSHFCCKNVIILSLCMQCCYGCHICKPPEVYRCYCMVLFHSQTQRRMIKLIKTWIWLYHNYTVATKFFYHGILKKGIIGK